jgi:hypothetical protein
LLVGRRGVDRHVIRRKEVCNVHGASRRATVG